MTATQSRSLRVRIRRRPKVAEVFNADTAPHPEVFAVRTDGGKEGLQSKVATALKTPGKHLVLWGYTGVGKTSLLQQVARDLKLPVLRIQARRPIDDRPSSQVLIENALAELGYERALQVERAKEAEKTGSFGLAKSKAGISRKTSEAVTNAIQSHSPDRALVMALGGSRYRIFFIDAFEFVPVEERPRTAEVIQTLMHELSDLASEDKKVPKVVIAGVADAAQELVPADGPVARRILQVPVPRMSRTQLEEIVFRGSKLLRLNFAPEACSAITSASDGFPFYTHHFAQHAVQQARRRSSARHVESVTFDDYELSLETAIDYAHLQLGKPYLRAVEPTRGRQVRKEVLEALAEHGQSVVSVDELRTEYLRLFPSSPGAAESGFIQRPLRELVQDYGLLTEIPGEGNRANLYRFRDPLMRAYVRLHRQYPHLRALHRDEVLAG